MQKCAFNWTNVKRIKHTKMKKIFLLILATSLAAGIAFAQELSPEEMLNKAIELANSGNEAFEAGSPELALEAFTQSLDFATKAGEIGAEHVETCKTAICNIYQRIAKDHYRAQEWDKAVEAFNKAKEIATQYECADIVAEADELLINTKANQLKDLGDAAKQNKDFATAAEYYQQMLDMNPTNGGYALLLGDTYYKMKSWDKALEALETAKANGQERKASVLIGKVYLMRCQEALKAKKYQDALDFAIASNNADESANAYKLGASASRALGKLSTCEEMYLKYLEIKPNASDKGDILLTLAASYQKVGNKAKAREYYTMLLTDPKHAATAKQQLPTLK